ncbi:DUF3892 domain-containing protein [Faecalispora anaeroviscerum]|uniref:DUF3892 domain-containing protein n=1 Tax=Faecalispora anaeroviscerum TaxID=2991836 RepID=UPI0024BB50F5|nr:DUF3892 domain-containing protein [Faecalispora anaeroviscerum]
MDNQGNQFIGNLPMNINAVTPTPKPDAQSITQLVKHSGRIEGYQLSNGQLISKQQGVELAKAGEIRGVAVAVRNGSEYLRSLPDGQESNNLGNLPSISQ